MKSTKLSWKLCLVKWSRNRRMIIVWFCLHYLPIIDKFRDRKHNRLTRWREGELSLNEFLLETKIIKNVLAWTVVGDGYKILQMYLKPTHYLLYEWLKWWTLYIYLLHLEADAKNYSANDGNWRLNVQRKRLDSYLISDIKIQEKWKTHLNLRDST